MKVIAAVLLCFLINRTTHGQFQSCRNPNQQTGYCVDITRCVPLYSVLAKSNPTDSEIQFMRDSRCGSTKNNPPFVCCTQDTDYKTTLPDQSICGGNIAQYHITRGNETVVTEFAWMVLLEYRRHGEQQLGTHCAGSLISSRYVVTAAHCLSNNKAIYGDIVSVRLGVHNTSDIVYSHNAERLPGPVRIAVEEIHVHESFGTRHMSYDIGLIRLAREVAYSPSIRPICLPSTVGVQNWPSGQAFTVAGWGRTLTRESSPVKMKLEVIYVKPALCRRLYASRPAVDDSHLCVESRSQGDSCNGDSGGPLMAFREGVWVLAGIMSFGNYWCSGSWPGVYTNALFYETWITQHIKP
ncbi:serine protease 7 [Drosophila mauritiana]|uniref:CLIP domain-containing serine protease n=1 Tax=Drosophila mauritiana TaxID=7226 RepID=A0A6P8KEU9_DROMA|nr:serine protease 7 [Drosophila mauritiana]